MCMYKITAILARVTEFIYLSSCHYITALRWWNKFCTFICIATWWNMRLLRCLALPTGKSSSWLKIGDQRRWHQFSPCIPVSCQLYAFYNGLLQPVLSVISPSSPWSSLCSLAVDAPMNVRYRQSYYLPWLNVQNTEASIFGLLSSSVIFALVYLFVLVFVFVLPIIFSF